MSKGSWSAPECVFVLRQSFRSAVANGHAFKNLIFGVHNRIILFYECGCPQRRVVVLRHVAGDAADFQSVTFSSVPARGIQECSISSIDVNDSHLLVLVVLLLVVVVLLLLLLLAVVAVDVVCCSCCCCCCCCCLCCFMDFAINAVY